jgi:hypothetical protein
MASRSALVIVNAREPGRLPPLFCTFRGEMESMLITAPLTTGFPEGGKMLLSAMSAIIDKMASIDSVATTAGASLSRSTPRTHDQPCTTQKAPGSASKRR